MISKQDIKKQMDALMLKYWGIISIDKTYRELLLNRNYFQVDNSILSAVPEIDRTVMAIAVPYELKDFPVPALLNKSTVYGKIESFSWEYDYHTEIKRILKDVTILFEEQFQIVSQDAEIYVDNSPYNDKEVGFLAGLGSIGHNHLLIHDELGTSFFIGYIVYPYKVNFEDSVLTKVCQLPISINHPFCGNCNLCELACPVGICDGTKMQHMKRCLSALTQTKEWIEPEDYPKFTNRLYGCSICQRVCPLAQNALRSNDVVANSQTRVLKITTHNWIDCYALIQMTQKEFKFNYGKMGFAWRSLWIYKRNALIVIGNTGDRADYEKLAHLSKDWIDERLRPYYDWALNQLKTHILPTRD